MGIKIVTFMSQDPMFKGPAVIMLALIALLYSLRMKKRGAKLDFRFWLFVCVAAVILVYGAYIVIVKPQWWLPPQ